MRSLQFEHLPRLQRVVPFHGPFCVVVAQGSCSPLHVRWRKGSALIGDARAATSTISSTVVGDGNVVKGLALSVRNLAAGGQRALQRPEAVARVQECVDHAEAFTPQGLAIVCVAFARLRAVEPLRKVSAAAAAAIAQRPGEFNEQDVSNIANALARARLPSGGPFFREIARFFEVFLGPRFGDFFTSQGLANTLNAHASLGEELGPPSVQLAWKEALLAHAPRFTAPQLANVLNSIARFQLRDALTDDPDCWRRAVRTQLHDFDVQGLSNVLNSYARLDLAEPDLAQELTEKLLKRHPREFDEQAVATSLNACARLGLDGSDFVSFLNDGLLDRVLRTFTSQGFANAALALSRLTYTQRTIELLADECLRRLEQATLEVRCGHGPWEEPHHIVNVAFAFTTFSPSFPKSEENSGFIVDRLVGGLLNALRFVRLPAARATASVTLADTSSSTVGVSDNNLAAGQSRLSIESTVQLYTVMSDRVLGRGAHALPKWPLRYLAAFAEALEACSPERMHRVFRDGVASEQLVELSRIHVEVSDVVKALWVQGGAFVVDEAFVAPYVVDILISRR
eukprot:TRINITY_DN45611_c0_g1_i1.p1 TRINITY_DN45611_c0_g1~~TRINITY_DN45611_c0_g1_i1.p1  ORF type:complete len:570 (+),score=101.16 TRINITY_DN45611_c0_g1_i1:122-1831(+)